MQILLAMNGFERCSNGGFRPLDETALVQSVEDYSLRARQVKVFVGIYALQMV